MTQSQNRILDEFAKLMNDAAGVARGMQREVGTAFRARAERWAADMDLARQEDVDIVREIARRALEENARLAERIEALEARIAALEKP